MKTKEFWEIYWGDSKLCEGGFVQFFIYGGGDPPVPPPPPIVENPALKKFLFFYKVFFKLSDRTTVSNP